jgi:hypothetical protein
MTTRHPSHRPPPPPPPPARRCGASQRRGFRAFGRSLADRPSRPVPGERRSSPRHSLPLPATGICPSLCIVFRLLFGRYPPPGRPSGPACPSLARCSPRGWASDRVPLPQLPSSLCRFLRCCPRPSDLRPPPPLVPLHRFARALTWRAASALFCSQKVLPSACADRCPVVLPEPPSPLVPTPYL